MPVGRVGSAKLALDSATLALGHVGPSVRVSRVVVGSRVERRVGFVNATVGQRCGSTWELAAPVTRHDERKLSPVCFDIATTVIGDWRIASALAGLAIVDRWLVPVI